MARELFHGFVTPQRRGVLALPAAIRDRLGSDEPGAQIEITERPDGVFELRSMVAVPADQKWFWEAGWQQGERGVDADIAAGRVARFDDVDALLADLGE